MKLRSLIATLDPVTVTGNTDVEIEGIAIDTRTIRPGELFVALRGTRVDGHDYIKTAIKKGAAALVVETAPGKVKIPVAVVPDSSRALALMAAAFHGDPGRRLVLCGITGTNGKSTTAILTRSIMSASSRGTMGLIGTLGWGGAELSPVTHTTPDASVLHRMLAEMELAGDFGVVMEVSSHAVRQHRVWGLDFEVGVITNVTHDHLDYHTNYEDYKEAKAEFCRSLVEKPRSKRDGTLVYWRDNPGSRSIGESFPGRSVSVGASAEANVYPSRVDSDLTGTRMTLHLQTGDEVEVSTGLLGSYVPVNAALAAAASIELGATADDVRAGLEATTTVPGRFEAIGGGDRPTVVIDYAHTSDAMEQVLKTCRELGAANILTVFGCGGDRDRGKRPAMGAVAAQLSDRCYVTTDNPRGEKIEQIVDDILGGMPDRSKVVVELDRALAIRSAIDDAEPGDVVALLGKGHENYQIVGETKTPFSDRETAEGALKSWSAQ